MDSYIISGGNKLQGEVNIRAAKNSVLPLLAASLLAESGEVVLHNIPAIVDVATMIELMGSLGARVHMDSDHTVVINASGLSTFHADYNLVRKMRASILVMGSLLSRLGRCEVSLPGGCNIGARPIDQHIKGFEQLGATFEDQDGYIVGTVGHLVGHRVYFDKPSHTGTENVMMAAVCAEGETQIINASCEPEVIDVANFLNKMGAKITGAGTPIITVEGVDKLHGAEHTPIGDRLEAGTYLYAAIATEGNVTVKGIDPFHLSFVLHKMKSMGAEISTTNNSISVSMFGKPTSCMLTTQPFPGFPTDLQPMAMAAMTIADGRGFVREMIFENRFAHTMELMRMGADINVLGDRADIQGVMKLKGTNIMASDIRGGAGLVVAALAAEGSSELSRIYHIDRGYETFERNLANLGANIQRVSR